MLDSSEYNLFKLRELTHRDERIRLLLGDVKDKERVEMAVRGANIVIHMAAIKHIDIAYYNPSEAVKTNVNGTENIVHACLKEPDVKKVIMVSSDKAVNPTGLYGVTKLIGEKFFQWAAEIQKEKQFCILRFGNVIESSGNVFEIWKMQKAKGMPVTVTSKEMKRYFWTTRECINFVIKAANEAQNGELFIPKMKKFRVYDIAMKRGYSVRLVNPRKDEKIDEELMTIFEEKDSHDKGSFWVVHPIKIVPTDDLIATSIVVADEPKKAD